MRFFDRYMTGLVIMAWSVLFSLLVAQSGEPVKDDMLHYRIWQFQDNDWEYLQAAIPKAKESGMNRIQLCKNIIMNIHELYQSPEKLELIRNIVHLAHQNDLKVDLWTHELTAVNDILKENNNVVINDALWGWLREKYGRAFKLLPETDGLVLSFSVQSDVYIYSDKVISDLSEDARVAKLIEVMADICLEHGKTLFIRTIMNGPQELPFMQQAIASIARVVRDKGNVVMMTKCVPQDWSPFYPYNPLLGNVSGLPQIIEMDLGLEFTGQSRVIYNEVKYIHAILDYSRQKGIIGAVARVDRDRNSRALGTPNEVNIYAFSRLMREPTLTADAIWTEWAVRRYGQKAAPYVSAALQATYDITNLTLYPLEQWIQDHSFMSNWDYTNENSYAGPASWILSPRQELARDELRRPDWITLHKIKAEKELARSLANASLDILEQGRPHLGEADYKNLKDYLELSRDLIEVFAGQNLAFCATMRYLNCRKGIGIEPQPLEELRAEALDYIDKFAASADLIEKRYGPQAYFDTPKRARTYAAKMRQLVEDAS